MSAVSNALAPLTSPGPHYVPREIVCHCLGISRDEIQVAIDSGAAESVKCVIRQTGAGGGCTACHCTIRNMLQAAGHTVRCATPRGPLAASDLPAFA